MKKRTGIILSSFILLISTITPALAESNLLFVGGFGMAFLPPINGHPPNMAVEVIDFRRTPFGWVDFLMLYYIEDGEDVPLMAITDNQDFADLLDTMIGMPFTIVVDDDELEVWRIGRRLYAELTTEDLPISPLYMEFKGWSGGPEFESGSEEFPTGYTITMEMMYFYADVTVDCHGIDCIIETMGMVSPHIMMKVVPP